MTPVGSHRPLVNRLFESLDLRNSEARVVLPQLAHNLSPSLKFFVNATENDWNLVFVRGFRSGWGLWR